MRPCGLWFVYARGLCKSANSKTIENCEGTKKTGTSISSKSQANLSSWNHRQWAITVLRNCHRNFWLCCSFFGCLESINNVVCFLSCFLLKDLSSSLPEYEPASPWTKKRRNLLLIIALSGLSKIEFEMMLLS